MREAGHLWSKGDTAVVLNEDGGELEVQFDLTRETWLVETSDVRLSSWRSYDDVEVACEVESDCDS